MRNAILKVDRWIRHASLGGRFIGCNLIIITAVIITFNSFSRYIFNKPFLFVDEYARYMLVAICYFGFGPTLRAGKHVSADVVIKRFNYRNQILLNIITSSIGSIVIFLMVWFSWKSFYSVFRTNMVSLTPLETPLWIPYFFVAAGITLFLFDMISHLGHRIKDFNENNVK